jgi:DnaJ-class molecular chaperone
MSNEDYYKILNVSKTSSLEEIKQAFKKLAREHHPDKGGDTQKFQQIQKAYETLTDPQKRQEYDSPSQPFPGFPFEFNHFNSSFFQHHQHTKQPLKMANHFYNCKISLSDVYFGITKKIKVTRERLCTSCVQSCPKCNGSGAVKQAVQVGPFIQTMSRHCQHCKGTGDYFNSARVCTRCHSNNKIHEERLIEIVIPKGVENGKQYVFEEWGQQANKSVDIPGCLVVTIEVEPHPIFERVGNDLKCTIDLSLKESIIGKKIVIQHFDGPFDIDTSGFGIINPNKQYTIFQRGIPNKEKRGSLHLLFKIEYPSKTLNQEETHVLRTAFEKIDLH